MRGGSVGGGLRLATVALAGMSAAAAGAASAARNFGASLLAAPIREPHHMGRTRYPKGYKPSRSIAGYHHDNAREIARRVRQAERNAARQRERAQARYGLVEHFGLSRRGRKVPV